MGTTTSTSDINQYSSDEDEHNTKVFDRTGMVREINSSLSGAASGAASGAVSSTTSGAVGDNVNYTDSESENESENEELSDEDLAIKVRKLSENYTPKIFSFNDLFTGKKIVDKAGFMWLYSAKQPNIYHYFTDIELCNTLQDKYYDYVHNNSTSYYYHNNITFFDFTNMTQVNLDYKTVRSILVVKQDFFQGELKEEFFKLIKSYDDIYYIIINNKKIIYGPTIQSGLSTDSIFKDSMYVYDSNLMKQVNRKTSRARDIMKVKAEEIDDTFISTFEL